LIRTFDAESIPERRRKMENVNENAGRAASTKPGAAPERATPSRENEDDASIWEDLRSRRMKASRRIGEGWERASQSAQDYADEHSIGVALGSFGVGVALGLLIGILAAKD
jgi:ElaB/YqjD/DUF883 family membrane-anchored ribosome-binding protein